MIRCLLLMLCCVPTFALGQTQLGGMKALPPPLEDGVRTDIDGKVRVTVQFKLCVDSTGRITCLEPLPKQGAELVNAMLDRVPSWRFTAASRDGRAVSAESTLSIHLVGERDAAGKYQMSIAGVSTGPRFAKIKSPKYPDSAQRALRTGSVLVTARVMPDGSLKDVAAVKDVSDRAFVSATLAAVKHWTLTPEKIDGQAVETKVRLPLVFSIPGQQPPPLRWRQNGSGGDEGPMAENSTIQILDSSEND